MWSQIDHKFSLHLFTNQVFGIHIILIEIDHFGSTQSWSYYSIFVDLIINIISHDNTLHRYFLFTFFIPLNDNFFQFSLDYLIKWIKDGLK